MVRLVYLNSGSPVNIPVANYVIDLDLITKNRKIT
jgi:hypothetical protein